MIGYEQADIGLARLQQLHTKNFDSSRLHLVELGHALNFGEGNIVAIFETVASFVKASHNTLSVLQHVCDHTAQRILSGSIDNLKLLSKVVEHSATR